MNEVITDKDKEYEAMEQSSAPGPDQAMSDRVNNRSLRPRSEAFKEFMTTGWDDNEPAIEPLESSHYIQARLDTLGKAFPGERIVIPAGQPKVRNNDCDYAFRPDTTFSYYTGLGEDYGRQDACAGIVCGSACEPLHAGLFHECPLWRILGWTSCRLAGDDCNDRY